MNTIADLPGMPALTDGSATHANQKKQLAAAQDFESLLIGQMLHSMRESGSGWLGTGDDDADAAAVGFGEEQLAQALTRSGGLGLSKIIAKGLAEKASTDPSSAPSHISLPPNLWVRH